ncbi:hypothetical protein [Corynebacterium freiburgense]|uniref:hypothetical protein n=1 Tax=Corynebacterium freiburgense TaxID=556548 RepID=UPI0003FB5A22|nr:hypothetical protein [Corynebacterium freiburgense]WJZ02766.1 hypothetical protein CFREI_07405 [Corynebacterium freiburgense]
MLALLLLMPAISLSFIMPFLVARIDHRLLRGLVVSVLVTVTVIGFAILMAVVENKNLLGLVTSVCIVALAISITTLRAMQNHKFAFKT